MFRVSIASGDFPMDEPQGQNRFFERCAQYLLELSDELERNLYIEAIVKEYRRYGISVEDLRKRVNTLALKGYACGEAHSAKIRRLSDEKKGERGR